MVGSILLAATLAGVAVAEEAEKARAMTGTAVPGMASYDRVIGEIMDRFGCPGAAVAVAVDGRLVFARGYGYAERGKDEVVAPDALFRTASVSKPLTAVAVLKLAEAGRLDLGASAYGILGLADTFSVEGGEAGESFRPTVTHLLQHTGGWDRGVAGDPMFQPKEACEATGDPFPPTAATYVRRMVERPLQHRPGTHFVYSNIGYAVLGRMVEKVSGQTYEDHVRGLLAEAGITRMRLGRDRRSQRLPGEVVYHAPFPSLPRFSRFPGEEGMLVTEPYYHVVSAMDAHGGWVASAIDLVRFACAVDGRPHPPDILGAASVARMTDKPSPPWKPGEDHHYAMGWNVRTRSDNWWHDGSLPGTAALLVRAGNGATWALLFNYRDDRNKIHGAADRGMWEAYRGVTAWPEHDLFDSALSYPAWCRRHGLTPAGARPDDAADPGGDPDGDARANLLEYALGTDPNVVDEAAATPRVTRVKHLSDASPPRGSAALPGGEGPPAPGPDLPLANVSRTAIVYRRGLLNHELDYAVEASPDLLRWRPLGSPGDAVAGPAGPDGGREITVVDEVPPGAGETRFLRWTVRWKIPR